MSEAADISLTAWEATGGGRILVGIGGFPASGKTTLAKEIVLAVNDRLGPGHSAHLPMDGFHLRNADLQARGLDDIKGDVITYDVDGLIRMLQELRSDSAGTVYAPDYVREQHEVSEGTIEIGPDVQIVCVEGIYVGYMEGRWGEVRGLIDLLLYLDADPDLCADRIISRNIAVGRDDLVIRRKLVNDFGFMERTITIARHADYIVRAADRMV
jgi:pantothenate kinase